MNEDYNLEINSSLFDMDLDEIGWEPEVDNDADIDSQIEFGY